MRVKGPSTLVQDELPERTEGHVLELESHPGMAISNEPDSADPSSQQLLLAPVAGAQSFCVGATEIGSVKARLWLGLAES